MSECRPSIMCLQETNFKNNHYYCHKEYTCFYKNRLLSSIASGGVAIYVDSSYQAMQIPLQTRLEAIAIEVTLKQSFSICNIYLSPSTTFSLEELENIYQQLPHPCIIVGDFNAHNILWGSITTSPKGTIVEDFLGSTNMVLLNTGQATRINIATGTTSALDLAFCDPSLAHIFSWSPYSYLYGSDHLPIKLDMLSQPSNPNIAVGQFKPRWNRSKFWVVKY